MDEQIQIDNAAKLPIRLHRIEKEGRPLYIGKLQMPGNLDLREGASFMVFLSEPGYEELQIGPLDPRKRSSKVRQTSLRVNDRLRIDLHPTKDSEGNTFYIGEAIGPAVIPCRKGIFFNIVVSEETREELQISELRFKAKSAYRNYESNDYDESDNFQDTP